MRVSIALRRGTRSSVSTFAPTPPSREDSGERRQSWTLTVRYGDVQRDIANSCHRSRQSNSRADSTVFHELNLLICVLIEGLVPTGHIREGSSPSFSLIWSERNFSQCCSIFSFTGHVTGGDGNPEVGNDRHDWVPVHRGGGAHHLHAADAPLGWRE